MFIICPYLLAWQSILHPASADRWKNDPCLTLSSITSFLPSLLSSWSPSETQLTACYISSSHSNPPPLTSSWQSFFFTVHALSLACSMSVSCNNWGWDRREGTFSKTREDTKESEYSLSLQPSSSDLSCPQWVQSFCIHWTSTCLFCHGLPIHIHTFQPYQMTTACWQGTQNLMSPDRHQKHSAIISTSVSSFSLICLLLIKTL